MSVELAYADPTGMTMTVSIGLAGKSLQETKEGESNLPQKYPPFREFPCLFSSILGFPIR